MFGGTLTKMCVMKVKVANSDNTPSAVDWSDLTDCSPQPYEPYGGTIVVQITGITNTISLHLEMYPGPTYNSNFNREFWYRSSSSSFSRVVCGGSGYGFAGAPEYSDYTYVNQYNATPIPFTVSKIGRAHV